MVESTTPTATRREAELLVLVRRMLTMMEHDHEIEILSEHYGDDPGTCSYCAWMEDARRVLSGGGNDGDATEI